MQGYTEAAEVFSEIHIERLLLFSVIWSYGSVLEGIKDQLKFSHLLKTLTNSLPDDDSQNLVFDYYVDESGEWDVWQSRYIIMELGMPARMACSPAWPGNIGPACGNYRKA
jgi:hypothetical protein